MNFADLIEHIFESFEPRSQDPVVFSLGQNLIKVGSISRPPLLRRNISLRRYFMDESEIDDGQVYFKLIAIVVRYSDQRIFIVLL